MVLVVDDDPAVRKHIAALLRRVGYAVLTAASAEDALTMLPAQAAAVDLLITDISMPGMDGVALASRFSALQPNTPVLLISGVYDHVEGISGKLWRFLPKPFTGTALLNIVGGLIGPS